MGHLQRTTAVLRRRNAPRSWARPSTHEECKLHQLSPYIGKLKSSIAASLIESHSEPGDFVLDPFCGSGTVPLESALLGRKAIASDASRYAVTLTRAKLSPPATLAEAKLELEKRIDAAAGRHPVDLRTVPAWVRKFFHPRTLKEAISFADECVAVGDVFLMSCLLGVLHHQRPGFLSYPSSHLVPYLRARKFPADDYPEMYEYRDIRSRLLAKVVRACSSEAALRLLARTEHSIVHAAVQDMEPPGQVDAIVTSPPYMNALDYTRDNRLRLWFLNREQSDYDQEPTDKREVFRDMMRTFFDRHVRQLKRGGRCVLVVGETVTRKRMTSHPAEFIIEQATPRRGLRLIDVIKDRIPDVRRSRRHVAATKTELILVFERT